MSACESATAYAAVIRELAYAKATGGDTFAEENRMWFGVLEVADRLLEQLETMEKADISQSNYIHSLTEQGCEPGKCGRRQDLAVEGRSKAVRR